MRGWRTETLELQMREGGQDTWEGGRDRGGKRKERKHEERILYLGQLVLTIVAEQQ